MKNLINSQESLEPLNTQPQKPNLWHVFKNIATPQQKNIIILLNLIFTMCSSVVIGLSLLYKEPIILCGESENGDLRFCTEEKACSSKIFRIDIENSPQSLSTEFGLICNESAKKRLALTCCFCGMLVGCIFSTFLFIPKKSRLLVICFHGFLYAFALLTMLFCSDFYIIGGLTGVAGFCYLLLNNNVYLYARENFSGELAGFTTISFNVCWALAGMSFAVMNYFTQANWKLFLFVSGAISFVSSVCLVLIVMKGPVKIETVKTMEEEEDEMFEIEEKEKGFCGNLKEISEHRQIKTNYIYYALVFAYNSVSYYCIYVEMDTVGGDLYLKIWICCGLELIAAIFTGVIIEYFDTVKILTTNFLFLGVFFLIFLFCPGNIAQGGSLSILFFTVCLFIVKINNDMLNIAVYLNVPKVVTEKYFAFWLLSSRFLSRFLNMVMPHFNYLIRIIIGIHPFAIYGVLWLGFRFTFHWTSPVESEGVEEILRETKCAFSERMSLICQSRSFASLSHDDMLKNIYFQGVSVSVFRKNLMRVQTNQSNLIKKESPIESVHKASI